MNLGDVIALNKEKEKTYPHTRAEEIEWLAEAKD